MIDLEPVRWRDRFVLARDARSSASETALYRAVASGAFRRVTTGAYLPSTVWSDLNDDERMLALLDAIGLRHPDHEPFCSLSAAALWRLPLISAWPDRAEVAIVDREGGRSIPHVRRRIGPPVIDPAEIDGHRVTPLARTLVDVARRTELATSVAMIDFALRPADASATWLLAARVDPAQLECELRAAASSVGRSRAERAVRAADGASGSPGESLSRVQIAVLGFPAPVLQHPFSDADGPVGVVDFWWPEWNLIGEFDGVAKYVRDEFTRGRSPATLVLEEKRREDRLRALGPRVVRWGWEDARAPRRLERVLLAAGLPRAATSRSRGILSPSR